MRRSRLAGLVLACIAAAGVSVWLVPTSNSSYSDSKTGTTQTTIEVESTPTATQEATTPDQGNTADNTAPTAAASDNGITPTPTVTNPIQTSSPTATTTEEQSADNS